MYAWGEKVSVSFSRVYVCVKATLTLVIFFTFFYAPSPYATNTFHATKKQHQNRTELGGYGEK